MYFVEALFPRVPTTTTFLFSVHLIRTHSADTPNPNSSRSFPPKVDIHCQKTEKNPNLSRKKIVRNFTNPRLIKTKNPK